jgi:serine/threonine protein kinase
MMSFEVGNALVGQTLAGKYLIERVVGEGGMGVVLAAQHVALQTRVAIKLLHPDAIGDDESVRRFLREARTTARLRSEHVVRIFDLGALPNGSPFLVMELLEGEDLATRLTRCERLPWPEAISLILQACEGLSEAHGLGIVHRDLKPANLFLARNLDGSPCVKLVDFGVVKQLGGERQHSALTLRQGMVGTPLYSAPEQLDAAMAVDARADIWSLGVVLYELITGRVPFDGETLPQICTGVMHAEVRDPRELVDDLPDAVAEAIARALRKSPRDRFADVSEFASALASTTSQSGHVRIDRIRRIIGNASTTERVVIETEDDTRTMAPWTRLGGIGVGDTPRELSRRRHRWFAGALAAVLLVSGAMFAAGRHAASAGTKPTFNASASPALDPPPRALAVPAVGLARTSPSAEIGASPSAAEPTAVQSALAVTGEPVKAPPRVRGVGGRSVMAPASARPARVDVGEIELE